MGSTLRYHDDLGQKYGFGLFLGLLCLFKTSGWVALGSVVGTGIDLITVYAPDIFTAAIGGSSEADVLLYTVFVGSPLQKPQPRYVGVR